MVDVTQIGAGIPLNEITVSSNLANKAGLLGDYGDKWVSAVVDSSPNVAINTNDLLANGGKMLLNVKNNVKFYDFTIGDFQKYVSII